MADKARQPSMHSAGRRCIQPTAKFNALAPAINVWTQAAEAACSRGKSPNMQCSFLAVMTVHAQKRQILKVQPNINARMIQKVRLQVGLDSTVKLESTTCRYLSHMCSRPWESWQ